MTGIRPTNISRVLYTIAQPTTTSSLAISSATSRSIKRPFSSTPRTSTTEPGTPNSPKQKADAQQNRTKIDRQSDEYSLTGSDDVVAANSDLSYSRTTDPDELHTKAERPHQWSNPLDASPANTSMSDTTPETIGHKRYHIQEEKGSYPSKVTKKGGKPGVEKKAFAGSTTGGDRKGKPESTNIQQSGSR